MIRTIRFGGAALLLVAFASSSHATPGAPGHSHRVFAAGEAGDPAKPSRTIRISMKEEDGDSRMLFAPDKIEVKRGEQIRFVLENDGIYAHEFMLDSVEHNAKHKIAMKRNPDMEHDDPNGKRLTPGTTAEILWRFTKPGTFEFACLIPNHSESGMHGSVVVR